MYAWGQSLSVNEQGKYKFIYNILYFRYLLSDLKLAQASLLTGK